MLPYMGVAILIAALKLGWIFYSRWNSNQEALRAQAAEEAEKDRRAVEMMGNGEILSFYAVPMVIRRGDHASMKIEPGVEPVKPTLTRCLPVSPKKTTEYTLTAEDGKGHTLTRSFVLHVVK